MGYRHLPVGILALALAFGVHAEEAEVSEAMEGEETPQLTYEPDHHYARVQGIPTPTVPEGKTEVLEFFWYGCPHCYKMEPLLAKWLEEREETAHLRLVPTVFSARWAIGARLYYTLEQMDRLDLHSAVFRLVHEQSRPLKNGDGIGRMLQPFDVDPVAFAKIFRSEEITGKLQEAKDLPELYDVQGVPAIAVAGRYLITSRHAKDYQEMLDIADYLIREMP